MTPDHARMIGVATPPDNHAALLPRDRDETEMTVLSRGAYARAAWVDTRRTEYQVFDVTEPPRKSLLFVTSAAPDLRGGGVAMRAGLQLQCPAHVFDVTLLLVGPWAAVEDTRFAKFPIREVVCGERRHPGLFPPGVPGSRAVFRRLHVL